MAKSKGHRIGLIEALRLHLELVSKYYMFNLAGTQVGKYAKRPFETRVATSNLSGLANLQDARGGTKKRVLVGPFTCGRQRVHDTK
jgi:hypothetical protein